MKALRTIVSIAIATFFLSSIVSAQRAKSILLPEKEAKNATDQCSRNSPREISGTWTPSQDDIKKMESKLSDIKKLRAKCCIEGEKVENLDHYYMQYVGIIFKGKKLIYINAFADDNPGEFWKETSVIICDGGTAWGVLYDPESGKFFDLSVNGVA